MMDISNVDLSERSAKLRRTSKDAVAYEDLSIDFKESSFGQVDFEKQYASAYFLRLEVLRAATMDAAKLKWVDTGRLKPSQVVGHVKSYKTDEAEIALVGVLFKDMSLKPNVLCDIQHNLKISDKFMSYPSSNEVTRKLAESDTLFLEDMEARLQLVFPNSSAIDSLPTGLVVAVLGKVNDQGFFEVHDFTLPGCGIPTALEFSTKPPVYVAMVSGLRIGSPKSNPMALQLLKDFLMGISLSEPDRLLASQISRVLVAGDTLYLTTERDPTASALAEADVYLAEIASVVPVSLMSGPRDPVNYCWPQQPLHSGLFPEARRYRNLTVHTNPFKAQVGPMTFLGSSGQNVTDLLQFTSLESGLDAMETIANSRYLAPTAPDTLGCYPFTTSDPLIITDSHGGFPHVLFAGNQLKSETRVIGNGTVSLLSIADFGISPSLLLVNVNNFEDVKVLTFDVPDQL